MTGLGCRKNPYIIRDFWHFIWVNDVGYMIYQLSKVVVSFSKKPKKIHIGIEYTIDIIIKRKKMKGKIHEKKH